MGANSTRIPQPNPHIAPLPPPPAPRIPELPVPSTLPNQQKIMCPRRLTLRKYPTKIVFQIACIYAHYYWGVGYLLGEG
jgi:hypothetical protein